MPAQSYELYRASSIGMALTDSLDELITSGAITPQLAMKVLQVFDEAIYEKLAKTVGTGPEKAKATLKGKMKTYRNCDDVWTFWLNNVTLKVDGPQDFTVPKMKIIACKHEDTGDGSSKK
ncbi:unnamed protein product [Mycena citricolor]|uniref:Transcription initiation factor IIA subunit 2 n=1 Tax=Mycena citricolor TaxID=2018698 RepID=A0AAD2Q7M9_9AGAR|nr:unnamed protein product [Mycena citricolor]CAK5285010.1 unnamed protein product [Mycena citricolor]